MSPYRTPPPKPPPKGFRVTRWMKMWVRWTRKRFYNRSMLSYRCAWCGTLVGGREAMKRHYGEYHPHCFREGFYGP